MGKPFNKKTASPEFSYIPINVKMELLQTIRSCDIMGLKKETEKAGDLYDSQGEAK